MTPARRRVWLALTAGAMIAGVLTLVLSTSNSERRATDPDYSQLESMVRQYTSSLERRDSAALAALAPSDYSNVREDAGIQVSKYGGRRAVDLRHAIRVDEAMTPGVANVDFSSESAPTIAWTATFLWRESSWKLLLGGSGSQTDGPRPLD